MVIVSILAKEFPAFYATWEMLPFGEEFTVGFCSDTTVFRRINSSNNNNNNNRIFLPLRFAVYCIRESLLMPFSASWSEEISTATYMYFVWNFFEGTSHIEHTTLRGKKNPVCSTTSAVLRFHHLLKTESKSFPTTWRCIFVSDDDAPSEMFQTYVK
jgi:hypothetical protein